LRCREPECRTRVRRVPFDVASPKFGARGPLIQPYACWVAEHLKVDAAHALETSGVVGDDAEELRSELARIAREWDDVSSGWSGAAATAYASLWEEWREGAAKLVEILAESTRRLEHAAVAYDGQEVRSATTLRSVPVEMGL
jgi:WXG100 family type VII secretion target